MKKIIAMLAISACCMFISCQKQEVNIENITANLKSPNMSTVKLNASPSILLASEQKTHKVENSFKTASIGPTLIGAVNGNIIGAVHIENNNFWKDTATPGMTVAGYADEFTMTPEWLGRLDVFHLGSLIKGNSLQDLSFTPLMERNGDYVSKPIYASVSFPSKTVSGSFMPDVMASTEFFSTLMQENGLTSTQTNAFSFEINEFTYYNEIKTIFGSNVDVKAIFFNTGSTGTSTSEKISKKSGLVATFNQKNFSVDMDTPEPGELYEDLNTANLGGVSPVYINSVVYGSKGIIIIESDTESETLKTTFNKVFSVMGGLVNGTQSLTSAENEIVSQSDLQIFFIGPNGEQAIKKLTSLDDLIGFVRTGSVFSPSSPGVPIQFKMRGLNNHQTIRSDFRIEIPFKPFYIKSEFKEDPNIANAPRHELHLSFFADQGLKIPIEVSGGVPIYAETKYLRTERVGSPREGFTMQRIYTTEANFNLSQGSKLIIKPVFLINYASPSPDGSYQIVK